MLIFENTESVFMFGNYPIPLPYFYHSSPTLSGTLVGLKWDLSGTYSEETTDKNRTGIGDNWENDH